jgi:hypothetical protein
MLGKKGPGRFKSQLESEELIELCREVGLSYEAARTGAAIALAESRGKVRAVGDNGTSIGLWQIHVPTAPPPYNDRAKLFDADFNARAMATISHNGADWHPWTTYRNGMYRRYLTVDT